MEYCFHVWGCGGSIAQGVLDKMQPRTFGLINSPLITNQLPKLQLRKDIASLYLFYRYYYDHCSSELRAINLPPPLRGRPSKGAKSDHCHSLTVPSGRTPSYKKSFLPRDVMLWNSSPQICFPYDFNLRSLKRDVVISFFLRGFADSVQGAGSSAAPSMSTSNLVKKKN